MALARPREPDERERLAMDTVTSGIRAVEFTPCREGDTPVIPDLLDQIPEDQEIGTLTDDDAFDTRRCHSAIRARGGTGDRAFLRTGGTHAPAPIRRNGHLCKEDCPAVLAIVLGPMADTASPRSDIPRATRHLGCTIWKRWSGHHVRSRVEARMRNPNSLGERIASRDLDRQTAEIQIHLASMNRFNAFGSAEIARVA